MKIQVLTAYNVYPPAFGGPARVFHLCRVLARGAEVRVACVVGMRDRAAARQRVTGVEIARIKPRHPALAYYLERAGLAPDVIGYDLHRRWPRPLLAALDAAAHVWHIESLVLTVFFEHAPRGALKVYASQNVEAEWFERVGPAVLFRGRWARRLAEIERRAAERADLVLAVSDEDRAEFVRRYGTPVDKIEVVENGFDPDEARPPSAEERATARRALGLGDERALLFVGSNFRHNRLAVEDLFRHVVPGLGRLDARLVLAGSVAGAFAARARRGGGGRVLCLGAVPDLRPALWAADVALHPVTTGAGSNVKLPMYLGAGLPVLSTAFGVRGFGRLASCVAQAPVGEFAAALARGVAYDPAVAGPLAWYSWDAIGERLAAAYRRRLGREVACAS